MPDDLKFTMSEEVKAYCKEDVRELNETAHDIQDLSIVNNCDITKLVITKIKEMFK